MPPVAWKRPRRDGRAGLVLNRSSLLIAQALHALLVGKVRLERPAAAMVDHELPRSAHFSVGPFTRVTTAAQNFGPRTAM